MEMESLSTALTTALTTVSTNFFSIAGSVLPAALGIGGAVLALRLGYKVFKTFTK